MLQADVLVAEIGSTTTVVNAFAGLSGDSPRFLGQGMAHTSVLAGDVTIGLKEAIDDLELRLGQEIAWGKMLATSSAAGGLRMTVHGLAYDMTVRAAREAALGAGAVVKQVTAGELSAAHIAELIAIDPNIILLAGGVDFGERQTAINNAVKLSATALKAPVVFAGNIDCRVEVRRVLEAAGKRVLIVDNVYPRLDELNIGPTRTAIQQVFEEHIVHAPGMERIRELVHGTIMPTPGAVMQAAEMLFSVLGDALVIDVGGATTDVHSVTGGSEENARLLVSPEPFAKRTVEGDLGVFVNARHVAALLSAEETRSLPVEMESLLADWPALPRTAAEYSLLGLLTKRAVETALERHVGRIKHLYGPGGRTTMATGKDLSKVAVVIGTGGPLTKLPQAADILRGALRVTPKQEMFPKEYRVLIDRDYNLGVLGVLGQEYKDAALTLMQKSLGWEGECGRGMSQRDGGVRHLPPRMRKS